MLKKIFKSLAVFFGSLIAIFLALICIYWFNPDWVQEKAIDYLYPTVNVAEKYENKIIVEVPTAYELLQIACSLTDVFQKDPNLLDKKTTYYPTFENYFLPYKEHDLVKKLNSIFENDDSFWANGTIRLLSLDYEINENNEVIANNTFNINNLLFKAFQANLFVVSDHLDLIEDFAKASNFHQFYQQQENYYQQLISNYNQQCDFQDMQKWLEKKFNASYQSYRIIFSPLTGGFHNTLSFEDKQKNIKQNFMFQGAPSEKIDSLIADDKAEIQASRVARTVFTEIDHNYVNPLTDKYIEQLNEAMPVFKEWNKQKNYQSSYNTFNEYMTWGVFCLYALDTYSAQNIDTIINIQENFMVAHRKFIQFKTFNEELIKYYKEKNKPRIDALYPPMLDWIARKNIVQVSTKTAGK